MEIANIRSRGCSNCGAKNVCKFDDISWFVEGLSIEGQGFLMRCGYDLIYCDKCSKWYPRHPSATIT